MIATKDSFEPHSSEQLPNSRRIYVPGRLHPDVRVGETKERHASYRKDRRGWVLAETDEAFRKQP